MPAATPLGIQYATLDDANDLAYISQTLAEGVDALLAGEDVLLTSGPPLVRLTRFGGLRLVLIDGGGLSIPVGNTDLFTGLVPAGDRPAAFARAAAYMSGYAGIVSVAPTGTITASNQTGATRTSIAGIVVYKAVA